MGAKDLSVGPGRRHEMGVLRVLVRQFLTSLLQLARGRVVELMQDQQGAGVQCEEDQSVPSI